MPETLRPESPKTETIVHLDAEPNVVYVYFTERREEFRLLVRSLGYRWDGYSWRRTMSPATGTSMDRAAETGYKLLSAGFIVRTSSDLASKIMAADYEPEQTRWIMARTTGKHAGWFSLSWSRAEDFYRRARKIVASRYDSPNVVVPAEQYEQVLDFAETYDFKFSPGATALVQKAQAEREQAIVVMLQAMKASEPKPTKPDGPITVNPELLDD